MIAREYENTIMGMPCGVFVLLCFHGYALWCFRTPLLSWVCLVVFSYSLAFMGMPHDSKGLENTTRHTHESKGVRKHHKTYPWKQGSTKTPQSIPMKIREYEKWCFRTPLLSWVCLVVFSYSLAIMGMPCDVFVLTCYHGYALWCFSTPLLSWVCLVVFSYSLAFMGIPSTRHTHDSKGVENTTRHTHDSKGVRKHHKAYPW
jgi:purine-cytosine permease-like protein